MASTGVRNLIRRGEDHQLYTALSTGRAEGMITMEQSLAEMARSGRITRETALAHGFQVRSALAIFGELAPAGPDFQKDPQAQQGRGDQQTGGWLGIGRQNHLIPDVGDARIHRTVVPAELHVLQYRECVGRQDRVRVADRHVAGGVR